MAKRYDVIVVGAGPAGLVAAKVVGENGFEVALVERKTDIAVLNRACGATLDSANEYCHHDLYRCNVRDKRLSFPAHGFSVKYDGPYRNCYAWHFYSPGGNMVQAGVCEEQKKKGDYGKITAIPDKEILLRCLLEEAKACSVEVFPGINVEKVASTAEGVRVEGSGQSFEGKYLIAADGANSRIAQMLGMNEGRHYYCQFRALANDWSGVEPPEPDAFVNGDTARMKQGPFSFFLFPEAREGLYWQAVISIDPRVDLKAAESHFLKQPLFAPWFKNAKKVRTLSADVNCYSPIVDAYKGRVLIAGDVGATMELLISGAMISGWKAGHAVSLALQEENLELEVTALANFDNWWKEAYVNYYSQDELMKNPVLTLILEPEEIDYLFSLIKEPMRPCLNPYTIREDWGQAMRELSPIIQQNRPEMYQKLGKMGLTAREIMAELTRLSKPVF